ncbi:glutamate-rich protein 5 isoform X2 [Rhinatrema bivittatum]|uniref:glutamate-rich protein 5 isoform X2 n=1 Tax=Rhinatrema bivittatum TaxID=194408 RepID=UPI001128947F|nr:glutamate-rich protein 5 isoform X2 [Rhinatrema bivittatum]
MGCSSSSIQTQGPASERPAGKAPGACDDNQTLSDQMELEPMDEAGEKNQSAAVRVTAGCVSSVTEEAAGGKAESLAAAVKAVLSLPSESARNVQDKEEDPANKGEMREKVETEMRSETVSEGSETKEETGEAVDPAVTEIEATNNEE